MPGTTVRIRLQVHLVFRLVARAKAGPLLAAVLLLLAAVTPVTAGVRGAENPPAHGPGDTASVFGSAMGYRTYLPALSSTNPPWQGTGPGFGGLPSDQLTQGLRQYVYHDWTTRCDYPAQHWIPMIYGRLQYQDGGMLDRLFNGNCNDGRPLLFLNEPAQQSQSGIGPQEAALMFYRITRGSDWPRARWRGPVYVGNNLVEDAQWDTEFIAAFAQQYNGGSRRIPEIAGWGVHLYGNFEVGGCAGHTWCFTTRDIPDAEIPGVVDRGVRLLQQYIEARRGEGNATTVLITEFGYLHRSGDHADGRSTCTVPARFMQEYVNRFDGVPQILAWFWFHSYHPDAGDSDTFNLNFLRDGQGNPTSNGYVWRALAQARQR